MRLSHGTHAIPFTHCHITTLFALLLLRGTASLIAVLPRWCRGDGNSTVCVTAGFTQGVLCGGQTAPSHALWSCYWVSYCVATILEQVGWVKQWGRMERTCICWTLLCLFSVSGYQCSEALVIDEHQKQTFLQGLPPTKHLFPRLSHIQKHFFCLFLL